MKKLVFQTNLTWDEEFYTNPKKIIGTSNGLFGGKTQRLYTVHELTTKKVAHNGIGMVVMCAHGG